jgi:uncharacterized protein (TIGR04255 family)
MKQKKLKNAPLKEAIFQLFWELPVDESGFPVDEEFDLAQGIFASEIKKQFPVHKRLFRQNDPIKIYPSPVHQFWVDELKWPVVQFGPGILTVNDTDANYIWEDNYRPNIYKAIEILLLSYQKPIQFSKISLQYIDLVDLPYEKSEAPAFISENLQTDLISRYKINGKLAALQINQVFDLGDQSLLNINIQTAVNNVTKKPAVTWITKIEKTAKMDKETIFSWIDYAHDISSATFIEMLNPDFYDSLSK